MGRTLAIAQHPTHYTWSFPGSPLKVRLALDVVERLQTQLNPDKNSTQHGLLLGRAVGQTTEIDDFTALSDSKSPSISEVAPFIPPFSVPMPVGFYRIHRDAVLRLNEGDVALAQALFPNPHQVLLLIQPCESGPATATFFFWAEGRMHGDFPFLEFPFDAPLLASDERQKIQTTQERSLKELQPVESSLTKDRQVSRRRATTTPRVFLWSIARCSTGDRISGGGFLRDDCFRESFRP